MRRHTQPKAAAAVPRSAQPPSLPVAVVPTIPAAASMARSYCTTCLPWLRFRNGRYRVDPSVSAEKLKTADWSAVANIDIHTQIGELLAEYIGVLRTMVESQMPGFDFELDFTLFARLMTLLSGQCTTGSMAGMLIHLRARKPFQVKKLRRLWCRQ